MEETKPNETDGDQQIIKRRAVLAGAGTVASLGLGEKSIASALSVAQQSESAKNGTATSDPEITFFDVDESYLTMGNVTFRGGNTLDLVVGLGSGAFARRSDPEDQFYTIADRGPNFNCSDAESVAGKSAEELCDGDSSGKIFTNPGYTPSVYTVRLNNTAPSDTAMVTETIPLQDSDGHDITAISNPLDVTTTEGAYSINGNQISYDPNGMDVEGIVRLDDGTFWIAEEYGPSIAEVHADGEVLNRHVPEGVAEDLSEATYPVTPSLPAVWRRRKLNRGIESIGITPNESTFVFAIQSPLADPDVETSESSRNIRVATFDVESAAVENQYLYRLDRPKTFERDNEDGTPTQSDVKISELRMLDEDHVLMLERVSQTTKLYVVSLADTEPIPSEYDDLDREDSLESLGRNDLNKLDVLDKTLVFSTDDYSGFPSKIEGIAMPNDSTLILINDNDFGYSDAQTKIARVRFDEPIVELT